MYSELMLYLHVKSEYTEYLHFPLSRHLILVLIYSNFLEISYGGKWDISQ